MKMVGVRSANLKAVGYEPSSRQMDVEFNSGALYRYYDVPPEAYVRIMTAQSHGKAFSREVKETGIRYRRIK